MEHKLEQVYHDPSHPAAYGGALPLSKATKNTLRETKKYLKSNSTYRKFFIRKQKLERARVIASSIGHVFQADLFDLQKFFRKNGGHRYILLIVDCFSRLVKARPLKHKTGDEVAKAMRSIFEELREDGLMAPRALLGTDLGTEFFNSETEKIYNDYGINHYALRAPKKSSMAEIHGRWLLDRIYKHTDATGEQKWVTLLQSFVDAKNSRPNKRLGNLSSEQVNFENQAKVYKKLYNITKRKPELPLPIGQKVLMLPEKLAFHKSFHGYFSDKVYKVIGRTDYNGIYRFKLVDVEDDIPIAGSFYKQELFPID